MAARKKREDPVLSRERRKENRIKEEDKIAIEILSEIELPQGKKVFNALTKDISPGGVRIMTNMALPVDTLIRMEILLAKRRRLIQATGRVRWARSIYEEELFEMGIEFIHISTEDKMVLLEHTYKKRD